MKTMGKSKRKKLKKKLKGMLTQSGCALKVTEL